MGLTFLGIQFITSIIPIESNQVSVHFFSTVLMVNGNCGYDCSVFAAEMKLYKFTFQLQ